MNNKTCGLIVVLLALAFASSGCDFFYRNTPFVPIPTQTISGPVVIGPEWIEIVPPEPLRPTVKHNWITLGFYKENKGDFTDDIQKGEILILDDGRKTKIEGFLIDANGESYELSISGRGGGIQLTRKMTAEVIEGRQKYKFVNFPIDRVYARLKIRSEIPLECDKIEWIGSKPK